MSARPLRCTTCGQPITSEPVRVCLDCGKPILRDHKFRITRQGLHHRHCRWPSSYHTPEQYRAVAGPALYRVMAPLLFPGVDVSDNSAYATPKSGGALVASPPSEETPMAAAAESAVTTSPGSREPLSIIRPDQLTDAMRIVAAVEVTFRGHAKLESCYSYRFWDDGFGPVWRYAETMGTLGVVRARTWDDAWNCVVDEIMDDADPEDLSTDPDGPEWPEGVHVRGSGQPASPWATTPYAQEDPNGSRLNLLGSGVDDGDREWFLVVTGHPEHD